MTGKRRLGRDPQPPEEPTPTPTPTPAPVRGPARPPIVVAPRKTRRELRMDQRRQKRRRLGAAGIAGLVVVALIVVGAITFGVKKATSGGGHKTVPGQTTLLMSVAGPTGTALESALLAHDPRTHKGVQLLLPSRVLTDVCGFGSQQLAQILGLPDGQRLSRVAVSGLLGGVTVDGSWVVTTTQLTKLIDEIGGITADVDTNVIERRSDGSKVLLVQKGAQQHLTGPQAVAFATYVAPGEDASANLVRLQGVIDGLLTALPHSVSGVVRVIDSLGRGATSTLGAQRLAETLTGLRADDVFPTALPIVKIDTGSGPPAYRVDPVQTKTFVQSNLAASVPASARVTRKRVFVQNGVGTPGLVGSACTRLVAAGYAFAGSGNAPHFGFTTSKVLVFDSSVASAELGDAVARALRLPASDVEVSTEGQNVADALVILGKDYKP